MPEENLEKLELEEAIREVNRLLGERNLHEARIREIDSKLFKLSFNYRLRITPGMPGSVEVM